MKQLVLVFVTSAFMACQQQPGKVTAAIQDSVLTVTAEPVAAAAGEDADTVTIGGRLFSWSAIDKSEFDAIPEMQPDTSEAVNISRAPGRVARSGDSLIFSLENGGQKVLLNNPEDNDNMALYTFLGFMPELQHWVVFNSGYEWSSYELINARNGEQISTLGIPQLSPDKKYFITANADLVAQFNTNGFELFENRKEGLVPIQHYMPETWGPIKIKWKNADTFYAEISEVNKQMEETIRHVKFSLSLK